MVLREARLTMLATQAMRHGWVTLFEAPPVFAVSAGALAQSILTGCRPFR
jgi:hypothetical protein